MSRGTFPFGTPVQPVEQHDQPPKQVFVLGVYASAVHARWIGPDDRTRVGALAVASEPYIFWRGDGVQEILDQIDVPKEAGRLVPASDQLNGPSGIALDELFLEPLGLDRSEAWLCDLVPYSCQNDGQARAIEWEYLPQVDELGLPEPTVPDVPDVLATDDRREEVLEELRASQAEVVVTLGDQPVQWFTSVLSDSPARLSDFGTDPGGYGRLQDIDLAGDRYQLLPLVHPRQAGRLGAHSSRWHELH